ncbi:MAG: hypothetical protein AAGI37_04870 [Planctomycetota bacterium]
MTQSVRSANLAANRPAGDGEHEHSIVTAYSPFLTRKDSKHVPVIISGITNSETLAELMPLDRRFFQVMRYLSYKSRTIFAIQRVMGDRLPTVSRLSADAFIQIEGEAGQRWLDEGRRYRRINVVAAPAGGFKHFIETLELEDPWTPVGELAAELKVAAERNILVDSIEEDVKHWAKRFGMHKAAALELAKLYEAWQRAGGAHK